MSPPAPTTALLVSPPASPAPTEIVTLPPISYEDRAATAVALATVEPFPTAQPSLIQADQPTEVRSTRGPLSLMLALPSFRLVAGAAAPATLTLHNSGDEPLWITGDGKVMGWLQLLDERGNAPEPWPWTTVERPSGGYLIPIAPGETISTTLTLQTPPASVAVNHVYALWGATRFARGIPGVDGPDNLWLQLEAGPLPLTLVAPQPDQQLSATLVLDRDGYEIQARTSDGRQVDGAWGELEASFSIAGQFEAFTGRPLSVGNSRWSGAWDGQMQPERAQIVARAWVAAPGYVTVALTQTVSTAPLSSDEVTRALGGGWAPCRQQFANPMAASSHLGLPVARLTAPPPGASLVTVQAEVLPGWATITTRYDLPNQSWLDFTQRVTTEQYYTAGWGEARYDPEAQPVSVGAEQGYLIRRYDVWVLNWKSGSTGLELRVPVAALSSDELVHLATTVETSP